VFQFDNSHHLNFLNHLLPLQLKGMLGTVDVAFKLAHKALVVVLEELWQVEDHRKGQDKDQTGLGVLKAKRAVDSMDPITETFCES
jgi:hypothetical protein